MSTAIAKNFQVGSDSTATNNFTIRQPTTPDGTVRIANGNSGTTTDLVTVTSAGNVGVGVTPSAWASQPAIQQTGGALWGINAANYEVLQNAFYNGTNYIYRNTNLASRYNQNAGVHSWFTAPSGTAGNAISFTQAMTLTAGGDLVVGGTTQYGSARLTLTASGAYMSLNSTTVGYSLVRGFDNGTERWAIGQIGFGGADGMAFYTGTANTERARITSGGNFGLGTTNPVYRMQVQANATTYSAVFQNQNAVPYGIYVQHNGASPNNAGSEFIICWDTTAIRFRVNSNGGIENYQANNVNLSDRREKTNFAPAGDYLSKICAIPVQTFNYIDQNMEEDPGLTLGVVAQDVQSVAPELVSESNLGTKEDPKMRLSIYQTDLQYALMKCIQELKAELDSVKTELALLKGTA